MLSENIDNLNTRVSVLEDTRIPELEDRVASLENETIPDPTERVTIIEEESIPDLQQAINNLSEQMTAVRNVDIPDINDNLDDHEQRISVIEDTELPEVYSRIGTNETEINNIKTNTIPTLRNDLQSQISSNDTALNTLQEIVNYIKTTRSRADDARTRIGNLEGSKFLLHSSNPLRLSGNYIYLYRADGSYDRIYVNTNGITTVASSYGNNGYMRLSNNFIIQWGVFEFRWRLY